MSKFITFLLMFLVYSSVSFAQRGSSPPDPNQLNIYTAGVGGLINQNTSSVSLRSAQTLNTGVANLVAIVAGQSNCSDIIPSSYSPTNSSSLDQMNINDGGVYNAIDPILGTSLNQGGGFVLLQLFDTLVTNGNFSRIVMVPTCIGGSSASDWQSGNQAGRIEVALSRLKAKGMVAGTNVTVIVIWMQGETDNTNGTSQASYVASLNSVIAQTRTAGFNGPWFVAEETWSGGAASAAVQAAQTNLFSAGSPGVINNPAGVYAGPNLDSLVGSICTGSTACRQLDNTHFTSSARPNVSSLWVTALHAFGAPF